MGKNSTIVNREQIVAALNQVWNDLLSAGDSLSDSQWRAQSLLPGWTIADIYAHVVGTERLLCGDPAPSVDVDVTAYSHVKNDIAVFNEQWIEHFRTVAKDQVLADLRAVVARRRTALESATDADFAEPSMTPAGLDTFGRFMRIRVFDCWMHLLDICDSLSLPTPPVTTVAAQAAWDEVCRLVPYAFGKGGKAPANSRIRLVVTGDLPEEQTINVAVESRAELVRKLDRDPDVTLKMPALQLFRLLGGRASAEPSQVVVEGDQQLGSQLIAGLGVTI